MYSDEDLINKIIKDYNHSISFYDLYKKLSEYNMVLIADSKLYFKDLIIKYDHDDILICYYDF